MKIVGELLFKLKNFNNTPKRENLSGKKDRYWTKLWRDSFSYEHRRSKARSINITKYKLYEYRVRKVQYLEGGERG